jgi:hypothetical protein
MPLLNDLLSDAGNEKDGFMFDIGGVDRSI